MQVGHQVTSSTSLQIPPQPETAILRNRQSILLDTIQPLSQAIINPKRRMEGPVQSQTPQPPRTCSSPGQNGKSCWSLDVRVAVLLVTLAGVVILLLLYRLLQLRHRLRLARARHALEYHSFFHTGTYTLKHPTPCEDVPTKNGTVPEEDSQPIQTVSAVTPAAITPLPPPPVPLPPLLPLPTPPALLPPPLHPPPSLTPTHPVLTLPLPLPVIHTTPPSPHLSWGACSDADVYSRIGAFRPSRLSSLSSQSKVILFEHSSL
ncbi:inverted formin-2 [Thunnus albacares]|uniref:inverted formin-2 n=1 Tax=Thunnus maccoyii TaxID=8240 RepID=UPI001C4B4A98|nr:inverted formin-2 [Thunnus maccoyii]XP_042250359.1 inverted formin-2 [Thunnus maccoyii]XP_042250360.1 inverted formin-2 [Thunnus maccoyii]XP_042250361.1 inverted formin-2 [Thunnus maccoyii]XP_042250362.1 inverted formin-2 [Thunnus maccoyii]XP_044188758.1 inverted formin-2 [Thunnus albacares]XP_044188759.1 inverted formin-2 [Thunnus albacares]XP_044188760.1 inverted formin-2 [Thunnus albacares]